MLFGDSILAIHRNGIESLVAPTSPRIHSFINQRYANSIDILMKLSTECGISEFNRDSTSLSDDRIAVFFDVH